MSPKIMIALALSLSASFASASRYSTSFDGVPVQDCPPLPPDQLHIIRQEPPTTPCAGKGTMVYVSTAYRMLFLCEDGKEVARYDVALGSKGVGKTTKDDRKTPIGTYSLGEPRESAEFGLFVPVGYPTKAQKAKGYTGDAIGIHGPKRGFRCFGFLNVVPDWTAGCMAVADDGFMARIANWIDANPKAKITIK